MFPENLFGKCWWQEQENDSFWVKFYGILPDSIKVGGGFHCKVHVNHRHTQVDPPESRFTSLLRLRKRVPNKPVNTKRLLL